MALNTTDKKNAKNLTKHKAEELIIEALELQRAIDDALEQVRKARGLDTSVEKRLAWIKDMINENTGKVTTEFFNHRAVYGAESERVSIPSASAKKLYIEDPETFEALGGEVKTVKGSLLRFEVK